MEFGSDRSGLPFLLIEEEPVFVCEVVAHFMGSLQTHTHITLSPNPHDTILKIVIFCPMHPS